MSQPRLGSGDRFKKLKEKLAHKKGIKDPGALAASIARKTYGNAKVQAMATAGKHRREG